MTDATQVSLFSEEPPASEPTRKTSVSTVDRNVRRCLEQHEEAMRSPRPGFERAIVTMFRGVIEYADAHRDRYGGRVKDDGYIGEAWYTLGGALVDLLNGETGRLDCATLDRQIRDLVHGGGDEHSTATARELVRPKPSPTTRRKKSAESSDDIGRRLLTERERELLQNLRVEDNFAVYVPDEFIDDWALLKAIMSALGGTWKRKTRKSPGGFAFSDDVDAQEIVRLALETGEILDSKAAEFFETGPELAGELAQWLSPKPGERLLEPSAGKGSLIRAVRDVCPNVEVVCVEPFPENREALIQQRFQPRDADFMALTPDELGTFDLVIMNPPFSKRQDIHHITHAISFLRDGGRLAAIASNGALYRKDRLAEEFRDLIWSHGGAITENPEGSFAHAGTMVRTVQIRLRKGAGR